MKHFFILFLLFCGMYQSVDAQRRNQRHQRHNQNDHHDQYDDPYDDHYSDQHDDYYHDQPFENGDFMVHPYCNSIYWHIIPLYYETFQLSYERITGLPNREERRRSQYDDDYWGSDEKRMGRRGLVGSLGVTLSNQRRASKTGFALEGQYRFYFDPFSRNVDMYGGPYLQFNRLKVENGKFELGEYVEAFDDINSFSGGLIFGLKFFVFKQGIIELQAGGGFRMSSITAGLENNANDYGRRPWDVGYTGVFPRGSVQFGFAFN